MQIHIFVEVTKLKNSWSLHFLPLEIKHKIYFITRPVIGVRRINQNADPVLDSQLQCWLFGINSAWVIFFICFVFQDYVVRQFSVIMHFLSN